MVPETGLEPVQTQCPRDFKSLVSTNFTTRAACLRKLAKLIESINAKEIPHYGAGNGDRTRGPDLGKVVLYH